MPRILMGSILRLLRKDLRMFKFLWKATFKGKVICQHPDDKYSKFDPEASYNPSSFRDFLDYFEKINDLSYARN